MIRCYCDICKEELTDQDFVFEATLAEVRTSLVGEGMIPKKEIKKEMVQICKGCFYKHISKLLKDGG